MEDQHLGDLLRELPRERARPGFTPRVLARLETPEPAVFPAVRRRLLAAAVAAALAVSAGGLAVRERMEARRAARLARAEQVLRELRAEHGQIQRELAALPDEPPVVYLGGDESMDLVGNLGGMDGSRGSRPAAYRYDTF